MKFYTISNFRELGGYKSKDGRSVKYGKFYRSGALGEVKCSEEFEKLSSLGIRTILDFRSKLEASELPDPEILGAEYYNICALLEEDGSEKNFSPEEMNEMFSHKDTLMFNIQKTLKSMYGGMPFGNQAYRKMFEAIEKENVPILFHCSGGKDRTGVAAMLILLALGADEQTVLDDYELTNIYRKSRIDKKIVENEKEIKKYPELVKIYEITEGVARSSGEYVLELIKEKYNSYETYFEVEFGLTEEKLKCLQDMYLE